MFVVTKPGMMSLLTDAGRFGQAGLGLTQGGPVDPFAFELANHLVGNEVPTTTLEVTLGGLQLEVRQDALISVTGAPLPLTIDGQGQPLWQSIRVKAGSLIDLGMQTAGLRTYLAVQGGFDITPAFGSTSTVLREGIGGLEGSKLKAGDKLPVGSVAAQGRLRKLPASAIPDYPQELTAHLIPAYQYEAFSATSRAIFFSSTYQVSNQADRMGYRLQGASVPCSISSMLSEGIALGAVQVPADGQPIVLLNDRQTIGGYPKLGSVLSLDCARLGQCRPGAQIQFELISLEQAHNLLMLHHARQQRMLTNLEELDE
ncbi:biotin-dependent carboxyltransferase family protein [Bowmanella pacifica]|uniref:Allophanate hydrolase n=1 Tax=Bowmanella pacifica TaxID=502051 RepID=A0A917YTV5_9ALTE|nr:biotin-dependent carboxyltransferase family protein [Bowmanella pacifica]GGO64669.1 allophanate hydrolase [Bowmanella pacifica]